MGFMSLKESGARFKVIICLARSKIKDKTARYGREYLESYP